MGPGRRWSHEALFGPELVNVFRARVFVFGHLREHGLGHLVDDVALVVTELVTNSLRHAGTTCMVRLAAVNEALVLTVQDGSSRVPVRREPDPLHPEGRGMFLVDSLSRDWGVEALGVDGKAVWVSFPVPPHPGDREDG